MANEQLKTYIRELALLQSSIDSTSKKIVGLQMELSKGTVYRVSGINVLETELGRAEAMLRNLISLKNKFMGSTAANAYVPNWVATGGTKYKPNWTTSGGTENPYTPNWVPYQKPNTDIVKAETTALVKAVSNYALAIRSATQATNMNAEAQADAANAAEQGLRGAPTTQPAGQAGVIPPGYTRQPIAPGSPITMLVPNGMPVQQGENAPALSNQVTAWNNMLSRAYSEMEAFNTSPYGRMFEERKREYYENPMFQSTRDYASKAGFTGLPQQSRIGKSGVVQSDYRQVSAGGMDEKLRLFTTPSGRVLEATSRQFQTFTSAIMRDVRELTKWSIAISLIYGPLNAMKTAVADMIEGQTRLADAMIATTDSGLKMAEIYNLVNQTASAMGESTVDSIEGFTLAYRATGNLGSAQERVTTATTLFSDALVLAKISGMEESQAIDTLAASLRQTNMPLNEGSKLLDKWVKTTQVANVDLTTLATGFAVLGDAAETAGMSVDELNGLLAAIAETGVASGKEVANTAKAIVAGFYGEKAVATLQRIGIATKDAEGNLRSFNEIATELYQQRNMGLISDASFQEAARAIGGGGNRRQAAVTTLIENYARVQQVANLSALAGGEAQAAMGKRLDTVQTSTQRLNNAFQSLAMTLGNEGGLLDLFSGGTLAITGLIKGFDELLSLMGRAGPMLLTILSGSAALKMSGPLALGKLGGGLDSMLLGSKLFGSAYANTGVTTAGGYMQKPTTSFAGSRYLNSLMGVGGATTWGKVGGAMIGGLLPAMGNMLNSKEDPLAYAKAGGNIGGAIVGSLLAKSPLIGSVIGSAVGEAIVTAATREGSMPDLLANIGGEYGYKNVKDATKYAPDKGMEAMYKNAGLGMPWLSKLVSGIVSPIIEVFGGNVDQMMYQSMVIEASSKDPTTRRRGMEALEIFNKAVGQYQLENPEAFNLPPTSMDLRQKDEMRIYGDTLRDMKSKESEKLLLSAQRGDITSAEYTRKMEQISAFDTTAVKYMATFGDELIGQVSGIESATDAYAAFLSILSSGGGETSEAISTLSTELYDLNTDMERINAMDSGLSDLITYNGDSSKTKGEWLKELGNRIDEIMALLPGIIGVGLEEVSLSKVKYPSIVNPDEAYSQADITTITKEGREAEFTKLRALNPPEVTDEEIYNYIDAQEDFGVYVEDFGKFTYLLLSGLTEGQFNETADKLFDEGKINTGPKVGATQSVQTVDLNSSQFPLLQTYTNQAMEALKSIPGYTPTDEDLKIFGKDWIGGVIHGDSLAMRLALDKILAEAEKMNEQFGVWNLPEGASFMVPFQSFGNPGSSSGGSIGVPEPTPEPVPVPEPPLEIPPEREDKNYNPDEFFDPDIFDLLKPKITRKEETDLLIDKLKGSMFDLLGGEEVKPKSEKTSIFEKIFGTSSKDAFSGIGSTLVDVFNTILDMYTGKELSPIGKSSGGMNALADAGKGIPGKASMMPYTLQDIMNNQTMNPIKIDLNLSTTTTVLLDGRMIATVVKTYLAKDLARLATAYGKTGSANII